MAGQNTSHAVMAQRFEPDDSADLFPTPPWATRSLCEWLDGAFGGLSESDCWEPAAGLGDMVNPLREYFADVYASDIHAHNGGHAVQDFLDPSERIADFIITNPPFRLAEQFVERALPRANRGVAMLVRSAFLEGVGRYERLFSKTRPLAVLQFTERVVMHKGKLSKNGSTATAYCWIVWDTMSVGPTQIEWIAPCRKRLERDEDYR